jgi:hypothetical protein
MPVLNFDSTWFRCYSKAKLESDPHALTIYVKAALDATTEAPSQPGLEDDERKAILVAVEDLHVMEREKRPKLARAPLPGLQQLLRL